MTNFRTEVEIPKFPKKLGYRHHSMIMGSCFAENTGSFLEERCLPVTVNPFGILYNPVSIANSLELLITNKSFSEHDLFFSNERYHSFSHHSRFSDSDPVKMVELINTKASEASKNLAESTHLFITFGTSWVFEHLVSGKVVSNCHKLPAAQFRRYRLTVEQITRRWIPLIEQIREMNPELHLVFTVSPIRHLKDGAHENQLSKSTLILAIDALTAHFGNGLISYFPSYELLLDELRDYRFYATDMTHPGEVAVGFILGKFCGSFFDTEAKSIVNELETILPALKHRPVNSSGPAYLAFIKKQLDKLTRIQAKYPFADFTRLVKNFDEKTTV